MKSVIVEAFCPELKGNPNRTGRGKGANAKAAISRAFGDVLKQVKGKRIHTINATVTIVEAQPEEKTLRNEEICS